MARKGFLQRLIGILFLLPTLSCIAYAATVTLEQAEHAALEQAPELKQLQAKQYSIEQAAIAAGQLADPKLKFTAMNIPVDTFDLGDVSMTQLQIGLLQAFPKGRSLKYRSLQKKDLSQAESEKVQAMQLQILRSVRHSWLDLYYWLYAKKLILDEKKVFEHLLKVTESLLANNKIQQKDVIRAQLELTDLDNQLININQNANVARAQLARWIGPNLAKSVQPNRLPKWLVPPMMTQLQTQLKKHPILRTDSALIASSQAGVKLAKQNFLPGFAIGVAYGFRQGNEFDGSKRSDFFTGQVVADLPIFPKNRQSRLLKSSREELNASQNNQDSHYRQLIESLKTEY